MRGLLLTFPVLLAASAARADDWPQWMGPNRDGVWKEAGILDKFPAGGPKKLWAVPVNGGYAGPAVAGGKVYVHDWARDEKAPPAKSEWDGMTLVPGTERVLCLDARTGQKVWEHPYPCGYRVQYGTGPRCTPTVSGGKVYTLGAMGDLHCLDAATGKPVWSKDFKKDYGAKVPVWGFSGHPLVYKNLVICLAGGPDALVVAMDKDTGKDVWKALSPTAPGEAGYAPPAVAEVAGKPTVLMFLPTKVAALDPATGDQRWSVPIKPDFFMSIMAPQKSGDVVFAGGHGVAVAVKVGADAPAVLWRGDEKKGVGLASINMTPFLEGDTIYGVDQEGMLRAVELKTGKRLWYSFAPVIGKEQEETFKGAGSGTAFLVKNGDRFFIFNEVGQLVIARLTPQGYEEVDKAKLVDPTSSAFGRKVVWSYPAFAEKCVFVRNDKEVACFSLAK